MAIPYILFVAGIVSGAVAVWLVLRRQLADTSALRDRVTALTAELATAEADKRHLQELLDKQHQEAEAASQKQLAEAQAAQEKHKQELAEMQQRLTTEFENIANRVLQQRQEDFSQESRKQIGDILLPLNERIKDFREQVTNAFSQETREKASLQAELKQLIELNQTLSKDATSLTQALKGDVKKQGNWGEFILEKVLEASGLRKGIEYDREVVVHGVEGDTLRPDVIIRMPDNKHIIVDSKVSLVAYEQLQHAESEEQYKALLKAHVESLKQHVKELYDKQYQRATGLNTPDFVLMFVPIEASYSVAIQADSTLYDYALERKIVIVSPTTLLATLHTISYVWKQENQSRNAQEIARLAGAMYDKLCGMTEDFQKVQKSLDAAQKAYNETFKKLSEGNGNVLRTADRIRELGAKASKSLPDVVQE
ncbi:MAG: DNA recombination protein RmuC [Paludibacteraceae bacterium]|nr:DNA recombination protein RmuC [Paludibacteraceae bacterium]